MTPPIEGSAAKSIAVGLLFLLLTAGGLLALQHSEAGFGGSVLPGDPGPFYLARICLALIGIAGIVVLLLGVVGAISARSAATPTYRLVDAARRWAASLGFVVSLIVMPSAMEWIGTTSAVAAFSILWTYLLIVATRGHSLRGAVEAAIFGVATAALIDLVFVRLLLLPLPA